MVFTARLFAGRGFLTGIGWQRSMVARRGERKIGTQSVSQGICFGCRTCADAVLTLCWAIP
jgi:hypothetical protein